MPEPPGLDIDMRIIQFSCPVQGAHQERSKKIPYLRAKKLENHTLFCCTYLHVYSPYVGVPPPQMLVYQTNTVGVQLFSYVNAFLCSNKFA